MTSTQHSNLQVNNKEPRYSFQTVSPVNSDRSAILKNLKQSRKKRLGSHSNILSSMNHENNKELEQINNISSSVKARFIEKRKQEMINKMMKDSSK